MAHVSRNLFKRVEVAFPVLDDRLRTRILSDLNGYLADTAQSWLLQSDGSYRRPDSQNGKPIQQKLMEE